MNLKDLEQNLVTERDTGDEGEMISRILPWTTF